MPHLRGTGRAQVLNTYLMSEQTFWRGLKGAGQRTGARIMIYNNNMDNWGSSSNNMDNITVLLENSTLLLL